MMACNLDHHSKELPLGLCSGKGTPISLKAEPQCRTVSSLCWPWQNHTRVQERAQDVILPGGSLSDSPVLGVLVAQLGVLSPIHV